MAEGESPASYLTPDIGNLGMLINSIEYYKQVKDRVREGRAYGNLGIAYYNMRDFKQAIKYSKLCLDIAQKENDRDAERLACGYLGDAYSSISKFRQAIVYLERNLGIAKDLGDKTTEGIAYNGLSMCHHHLGEFHQAMSYCQERLRNAKEMGDRAAEGSAYGNLGISSFSLGQIQQALEYQLLSKDIAIETADKSGEGRAYSNLGIVYDTLGSFRRAVQCHELHLRVAKETGDRAGEGRAYDNMGITYRNLCDFKRSIECHKQALAIAIELGNKPREAGAYCNIGNTYVDLGDFKQAIQYHKKYKSIVVELGGRAEEGNANCNLGYAYQCYGDLKSAVKYQEMALSIAKDIGDKSVEGKAYGNLGILNKDLGNYEQAIKYHQQSLAVSQKLGDKAGEARTYSNIANVHSRSGHFKEAIEYAKLDLAISKEIGDRAGQAKSYYNIGCNFKALGALEDALYFFKASVEIFNQMRRQLQDKDEWKISIQNEYHKTNIALWSLLKVQGNTLEALLVAEQGRAQALDDLMVSQYGIDSSHYPEQDAAVRDIVGRVSSNVYYTAIQGNDINIWILQEGKPVVFTSKTIDTGIFQEASVEDLQSFVDQIINKICTLKSARCEDRSLDKLFKRNNVIAKDKDCEEPFTESSENSSQAMTSAAEDTSAAQHEYNRLLRILYDITVAPIADLCCDEEIIIIPDGPLLNVPFAALLDPYSRYLCESLRIRMVPSLTSLKLITDAPVEYHATRGALIVGDPWVQEIVEKKGRHVKNLLSQLPGAKEEVEMIARILDTSPLIGNKATKAEVLKRLNSVALVHIAAHGDSTTGEIALAPNPKRNTKNPRREDYLLTMEEVLSVGLRARLVVLSCCHSGRGAINSEGVVGIARAFLGAGARSVLVSLWAIDDTATKEFMCRFYQQLVDGKSACEALNDAMESQRRSPKFSAVQYWAPFVLVGDDVILECE